MYKLAKLTILVALFIPNMSFAENSIIEESESFQQEDNQSSFKVGTYVMNQYSHIYRIVQLFADGRVLVNTGSIYYISQLKREVQSYGNLKNGTVVITRNSAIRTVSRLFEDGRVLVNTGSVYWASELVIQSPQ